MSLRVQSSTSLEGLPVDWKCINWQKATRSVAAFFSHNLHAASVNGQDASGSRTRTRRNQAANQRWLSLSSNDIHTVHTLFQTLHMELQGVYMCLWLCTRGHFAKHVNCLHPLGSTIKPIWPTHKSQGSKSHSACWIHQFSTWDQHPLRLK